MDSSSFCTVSSRSSFLPLLLVRVSKPNSSKSPDCRLLTWCLPSPGVVFWICVHYTKISIFKIKHVARNIFLGKLSFKVGENEIFPLIMSRVKWRLDEIVVTYCIISFHCRPMSLDCWFCLNWTFHSSQTPEVSESCQVIISRSCYQNDWIMNIYSLDRDWHLRHWSWSEVKDHGTLESCRWKQLSSLSPGWWFKGTNIRMVTCLMLSCGGIKSRLMFMRLCWTVLNV